MPTRKRPPPNPLDPDSDPDTSSPPTSKKRPFQQKPPPTTTSSIPPPPPPPQATAANDDDDEDDYMNMTIAEPSAPETFSQRKKRLQLEAETRARPKSKAELAALEKANREAALAKSLLDTKTPNKGLLMMRKMGFTPGSALGAPTTTTTTTTTTAARLEPIPVTLKEDRTGIGHASAQRAKLASTATTAAAAAQLSPEDYRARVASEQEERRREAQLVAAQKLAEEFSCEQSGGSVGERTVPLRSIPVLWRGLVKRREEHEREKRMRYDLLQSLDTPRLPGCARDCELDEVDKAALGITVPGLRRLGAGTAVVEEDSGEEGEVVDGELEREEARAVGERVVGLCEYLRREYRYCFWCKCRYEDEAMEGCPGVEEDLHG